MEKKLNGSVHRLAEAFGDVITEAMESVRNDIRTDIREEVQAAEVRLREEVHEVEERLGNRIDRAVEDIVAQKQP